MWETRWVNRVISPWILNQYAPIVGIRRPAAEIEHDYSADMRPIYKLTESGVVEQYGTVWILARTPNQ